MRRGSSMVQSTVSYSVSMLKRFSSRRRREATLSSSTISAATKARPSVRPSARRERGSSFCRPIVPILTRSNRSSPSSTPPARGRRAHPGGDLEAYRCSARLFVTKRMPSLPYKHRIWCYLNTSRSRDELYFCNLEVLAKSDPHEGLLSQPNYRHRQWYTISDLTPEEHKA